VFVEETGQLTNVTSSSTSTCIYTDADNTLWDTDGLFAEAQLLLLSAAEQITQQKCKASSRLEFVRSYDQAIAAKHHAHLRYPPALLLRALEEGLHGGTAEETASKVLAQGYEPTHAEAVALTQHSALLSRLPTLLSSVREGLDLARSRQIPVYVVSEGPIELLRSRLQALHIDELTDGALSVTKSRYLYERLLRRAASATSFMIGDQADRDVRLAREAGMHAILVPGRFRPRWMNDKDAELADAVVENFQAAIEYVVSLLDGYK
jgi:putative hydrolase of the HAD superfamily